LVCRQVNPPSTHCIHQHIFHISFISFSQSLQVNEPSDIEHVTVSALTAISQGKQLCINIRGVDRWQSSRIPTAIWLTFREQI
jgi:hypothetical protein